MSRTVHHVPCRHWNRRAPSSSLPVAHVLVDLRFAVGCRRVPKLLRHEVPAHGFPYGHGGTHDVTTIAYEFERRARAEWRTFAVDAIKSHRAGADLLDLFDLLEPDSRTRHGAIWDAF